MKILTNLLNCLLFPIRKPNFCQLEQCLRHKTIIITGASFGIGEALCHLLSDIECQLILVARTADKLQLIEQSLSNKKAKIDLFCADLRDVEQLDSFIAYLASYHVDVFINNAGISICRPIMQSLDRMHDFERTIKLNYLAPVKLCLALIPKLQQSKGHIINVSAINVLLAPTVNWAAYQASKTAFDQWLRCASSELENRQIKVSTAYLPLVKTRMIAPTKIYKKLPALQPCQAATIISRLLVSQKRQYKPWWVIIGQLASVIFNGVWCKLNSYYIKKKQ
ncbi:Short-chain dehydrogenase [Gilliamella bombicola]|uniref:Short-chain dehydrogenase n=1 Tax=Gilliamella bombicola TaxID=1798182 RepID=A0A1C4A9Q2_9GAMM|nr:SDR family NAD(P)-dependent oxidoreductase [Gilliamella bombicola]SCB91302.1 Short-chain dehydrogenase [Gilliamella bombicola]